MSFSLNTPRFADMTRCSQIRVSIHWTGNVLSQLCKRMLCLCFPLTYFHCIVVLWMGLIYLKRETYAVGSGTMIYLYQLTMISCASVNHDLLCISLPWSLVYQFTMISCVSVYQDLLCISLPWSLVYQFNMISCVSVYHDILCISLPWSIVYQFTMISCVSVYHDHLCISLPW